MTFVLKSTYFCRLATCVLLLLAGAACYAADPTTADLVRAAKSGDEPARVAAIDAIGARGSAAAEAVAPLTELLADRPPRVRAHAVWALGRIGTASKPSANAIIALLKDPDETVRRQAISALLAIRPGTDVVVPVIIKMLEDSDEGVRMRILHAVTEAGSEAVPGLIQALADPKGVYWACLVLRDLGPAGKDALPALVGKLKDPRAEIRREAVLAIGAMGDVAASAVPQIAPLLDDEPVRTAATFALGQIGQVPAAAEPKITANAKSNDKMLVTVSLWTLARVHPSDKALLKQAAEHAIELLKDPDPFVRVAAARALAALPPAPEITVPLFEKALEGADEATAHHALDALVSMGPPAVPRLMDVLKRKQLRPQIAYILGQMGPPAAPAAELLAEMTTDPNDHVAEEAALALAKIGPDAKAAVPRLVTALSGQDRTNLHAITYALGRIGPAAAAAAPKMAELMNAKDDPTLPITAAWALVQIQPNAAPQAVGVLTAALTDSMAEKRVAAADALGGIGAAARGATAALEAATRDADPAVRSAATEALKQIRGEGR